MNASDPTEQWFSPELVSGRFFPGVSAPILPFASVAVVGLTPTLNGNWLTHLWFVCQELNDLARDPPAQCSAGPVGDDSKFLLSVNTGSWAGSTLSKCRRLFLVNRANGQQNKYFPF